MARAAAAAAAASASAAAAAPLVTHLQSLTVCEHHIKSVIVIYLCDVIAYVIAKVCVHENNHLRCNLHYDSQCQNASLRHALALWY